MKPPKYPYDAEPFFSETVDNMEIENPQTPQFIIRELRFRLVALTKDCDRMYYENIRLETEVSVLRKENEYLKGVLYERLFDKALEKEPEDIKLREEFLRCQIGSFFDNGYLFSNRVILACNSAGIKTVRELKDLTEEEFMKLPNIGRKSLNEVREVFSYYGLVAFKRI